MDRNTIFERVWGYSSTSKATRSRSISGIYAANSTPTAKPTSSTPFAASATCSRPDMATTSPRKAGLAIRWRLTIWIALAFAVALGTIFLAAASPPIES